MKLDDRYIMPRIDNVHFKEFEALYDYGGIVTLYDDLELELGRIPTPTEFIEQGLNLALAFFGANNRRWCGQYGYYTFEINEELIRAIKSRLKRAYMSRLIESCVIDYLKRKYPKIGIASSNLLDLNFGVDLVLRDKERDRLYYVHVLKNSKYSDSHLRDKGSRVSYRVINGNKVRWHRNWGKAHVLLKYNDLSSDRMQEVYGNLIFKDEYLDRYFENLFGSDRYEKTKGSEFEQFLSWVKVNGIEWE